MQRVKAWPKSAVQLLICVLVVVLGADQVAPKEEAFDWHDLWLQHALEELAEPHSPGNVDEAIWVMIYTSFAGLLAECGSATRASLIADCRPANQRVVTDGQDNFWLCWEYRNPGDFNRDGSVNLDDLRVLAEAWGTGASDTPDPAYSFDLDSSGLVDDGDLQVLAQRYGTTITYYAIYCDLYADDISGEMLCDWNPQMHLLGYIEAYDDTVHGIPAVCKYKLPGDEYQYPLIVQPVLLQPDGFSSGSAIKTPVMALRAWPPCFQLPAEVTVIADLYSIRAEDVVALTWYPNGRADGTRIDLDRDEYRAWSVLPADQSCKEHYTSSTPRSVLYRVVAEINGEQATAAEIGIPVFEAFPVAQIDPAISKAAMHCLPMELGYCLAWAVEDPAADAQEVRVVHLASGQSGWSQPATAFASTDNAVSILSFTTVGSRPALLAGLTPLEQFEAGSYHDPQATVLILAADQAGTAWHEPRPTGDVNAGALCGLDGHPALVWLEPLAEDASGFSAELLVSRAADPNGRHWNPPQVIDTSHHGSSLGGYPEVSRIGDRPLLATSVHGDQHSAVVVYLCNTPEGDSWRQIDLGIGSGQVYSSSRSAILDLDGALGFASLQSPYADYDIQRTFWHDLGTGKTTELRAFDWRHGEQVDPGYADGDAQCLDIEAALCRADSGSFPAVMQVLRDRQLGLRLKLTALAGDGWAPATYWPIGGSDDQASILDLQMIEFEETPASGICWLKVLLDLDRDGTRQLALTELPLVIQ